jgi:4'-phosphopantetheinyl transferase
LEFRDGKHGKPRLAFPGDLTGERLAALDFNLSHSENVLALAVAFGGEVGIDVEVVNPAVDLLAVAEAQFAKEDFAWLRALPASECTNGFYRLWTRQEALAKADGRGIASRPAVAARTDSPWQLHSFAFKLGDKEIVGALALGGTP